MGILLLPFAFLATVMGLRALSWHKEKKGLQHTGICHMPLGWRIAVNWSKAHGYDAVEARIVNGKWEVLLAEGWVSIQKVVARPSRPAIIDVQCGVVNG